MKIHLNKYDNRVTFRVKVENLYEMNCIKELIHYFNITECGYDFEENEFDLTKYYEDMVPDKTDEVWSNEMTKSLLSGDVKFNGKEIKDAIKERDLEREA